VYVAVINSTVVVTVVVGAPIFVRLAVHLLYAQVGVVVRLSCILSLYLLFSVPLFVLVMSSQCRIFCAGRCDLLLVLWLLLLL